MKKIFVFVLSVLITQTLIAQTFPGPETVFEKYFREYSQLFSPKNIISNVDFSFKTVDGQYTTKEQNKMEIAGTEDSSSYSEETTIQPAEVSVTDSYKEVRISIPEGYSINKYVVIDSSYPKLSFPFVSARSILLKSNGKDISFQLDYDLKLTNTENLKEIPTEYINQAITLTIRYSPKYFTLKRDYVQKPERQIQVQYQGRSIDLNAEVYPFLIITTPKGKDMVYILEPNWQNIYDDFEFVREGHKTVEFENVEY